MIKILHIARPVAGVGVYISLLSKYINSNQFSNAIVCNTNEKIISSINKSKPIFNQLNKYSREYSSSVIESVVYKIEKQ